LLAGRTVDELADYIILSGQWDGHQPIRLQSCRAGEGDNSYARQLAAKLKAIVIAPDAPVWFNPLAGADFEQPYMPISIFDHSIPFLNPTIPGTWRIFGHDGELGSALY